MFDGAPYLSYSRYLKKTHGRKVYRVAVDGGFSCPNRGRDRSSPGCLYCDASGSRAPYLDREAAVEGQIQRGLTFIRRRYEADLYSLYFQAYTSTWGRVEDLERLYSRALDQAPFCEFIVSTRPDCLSAGVADLLASYRNPRRDVWVELGLQSSHDASLRRINRGHSRQDFEEAFFRLRERGIKVAVHLILGLPGEDWAAMEATGRYAASLNPEGVKIHNLHIAPASPLMEELKRGELPLYSSQRHLEYTVRLLELLPPETVIMRLTCDTPRERGRLPGRIWQKSMFISRIRDKMLQENRRQGNHYGS